MSETASPHARPASAPQGQRPASAPVRRQYVSFSFYKLDPEFRRQPIEHQRVALNQLADLVEANDRQKMILPTYSCIGTRGDVDIMFWKISFNLDDLQVFSAA